MKRALMRSTAIFMSIIPGIHASRAETGIGSAARYEEFRQLTDKLRVKLEKRKEEGLIVILPKEFPRLPNYAAKKLDNGRLLISPASDDLYQDCRFNANAGLTLDVFGGIGADITGMAFNGAAAYGRSQIAIQQCINDYRDRLYSALSSAATDQDISKIQTGFINIQGQISQIQDIFSDQKVDIETLELKLDMFQQTMKQQIRSDFNESLSNFATKLELEEFLSEKMTIIQKRVDKYYLELKEKKATASDRQKAQKDIADFAVGLNVIADFAFRKDPVARNAMKNAINSFSQLAQICIALTASGPGLPTFLLVLSAAGVVNNLIASMTGSGPTSEDLILREVQNLNESISTLRKEMNGRLDDIIRMIDSFSQYTKYRFDGLDAKVDITIELLRQIKEDDEIKSKITEESIGYLLSSPIKLGLQKCFEGHAAKIIAEDDFAKCVADFKLYATEIAKADIIAGSGRISKDPLSEVGQQVFLTVDSSQNLGYLISFYERISNKKQQAVANPAEWYRGASAYIKLIDQYPSDRFETNKKTFIHNEKANIDRLIAEAIKIKLASKNLRQSGLDEMLQLYAKELRELSESISKSVIPLIELKNLGLLSEHKERFIWTEQVDNHSSVFKACARIDISLKITEGLAKDEKAVIRSGQLCGGSHFTNKDNDASIKQTAMEFAKQWPEDQFPWKSVKDSESATKELQRKILEVDLVSKIPDQAYSMISPSVFEIMESDDIERRFVRLNFLKQLMLQAMIVGKPGGLSDGDRELAEKISQLPSDAEAARSTIGGISYRAAGKIKEIVYLKIKDIFDRQTDEVSLSVRDRFIDDSYPFIDQMLWRLKVLNQINVIAD